MNPRYLWPVALIVAGILFLLDNLGLLPGNAWGWIWPLVLVALGLNLLLGRRASVAAATEASLPLDGATAARLTARHGAGRLEVRAGANANLLFSGSFGGGVRQQVQRDGEKLDVTLQAGDQDWTEWMWPAAWIGPHRRLDWSLALNPNVPLSLKIDTGASEGRLDLSALRVTDLEINTGASSTEVILPARAGHTRARITAGAASVKVNVPEGVAARVQGRIGVGALNVDQARFPRRGSVYESDGFETAANRVELAVEGGAGEISVR
jgi:hypothetical protein